MAYSEEELLDELEEIWKVHCRGGRVRKRHIEKHSDVDIEIFEKVFGSVRSAVEILEIEKSDEEGLDFSALIQCSRCERYFDPERDTREFINSRRCEYCGQKHSLQTVLNERGESEVVGLGSSKVYLISDGDFVKIGVSLDPQKRMYGMQTSSATELELLATCEPENAGEYEKKLHTRYEEYRRTGEWFDIPEEDLEELIIEFSVVDNR